MTMPYERTRALRWAGEFLEKLKSVDLPEDIKREIQYILRHYPSGLEIANEAKLQALIGAHSADKLRDQPWLSPEESP